MLVAEKVVACIVRLEGSHIGSVGTFGVSTRVGGSNISAEESNVCALNNCFSPKRVFPTL